ncbi:Tim10/DDP family zinc finger-domain-containing protein [Suillus fuscotomentosus]|uniref:Mitochondrial import inner membrane translocase subunit n=2 Tax=Suillus TaxID=5379 RepID=A0AAD4DYA1_9AGAM|nr:Tim10/DDP family zinc finger-domain-containing protein [Suillus fuscotomentosus]KAG1866260.1 Tim10/DDP family zinc finger-domain-containing protein [Suillus tomentosus]KAG1894858.1 Tim10/DDP family zinc finger-domain-containing protein [Suillus fuscotomentosus]
MDNVKFDEATQKELATFLEREQAQARINSTVHNLTSMCWDKCVTGTPGSRFARGEESCLLNCVDRFMDTSLFIIKTIESQRPQQS